MTSYKQLLFIIFTLVALNGHSQTKLYNLTFKVNGIKNDTALFAYNYGEKKFIRDSLFFDDKGVATIKGEKDYPPGVYLIAFPSLGNTYFELVLRETSFEMSTDKSDFLASMKIKNSKENQVFYDDVRFMNSTGLKIDSLKKSIAELPENSPLIEITKLQISNLTEDIRASRSAIVQKHPTLLYSKLVNAMKDIEIPPIVTDGSGEGDPNYAYFYVKEHYFDGVDFSDSALIRTPVLLPKVFRYMDEIIIPMPDSIIAACDRILSMSAVNGEMFRVMLSELINKYAKSNIMGQEKVYVHLVDNYYAAGKAPWVDEETLTKMKDRSDALRPTMIGNIAPDMNVYGLDGQIINLYKSIANNRYTILAFWNSECSHCKKEIPEIQKLWTDSLQTLGVGVFSVSTEVEKDEVQKFIDENKMSSWINGYDPTGRMPFRKQYDLVSTPVVIILNQKKEIIAKKIGVGDIMYVVKSYDEYQEKMKNK